MTGDSLELARAIHADHPVVDLHADPLLWSRLVGYDLLRRHRNRLPRAPFWSHSDLPRWRDAAMNVVLTGVVTLPSPLPGRGYLAQAISTINHARRFAAASDGGYTVVDSLDTLDAALAGDTVGGLLDIGQVDRIVDHVYRPAASRSCDETFSTSSGGDLISTNSPKLIAQRATSSIPCATNVSSIPPEARARTS